MALEIGSLVTFSYQSNRSHDPYPQVLILHPGWRYWPNRGGGKPLVHGLNFNYLTNDEINIVRMMIDPSFELKYLENMNKKNHKIAAELDRIMSRASTSKITSPHDFYIKVIRPFIVPRGYDPYRLYDLSKMRNLRVLQNRRNMTGESKMSTFGSNVNKGKGKDEDKILKDLAAKKAQEDTTKSKILSPEENRLIQRLAGNARNTFQKYKKQFQNARGPVMNNRGLNFKKNQSQPSWMDDPIVKRPSWADED